MGLCVDCERPVRGGFVCTSCLALLHPLCARGSTCNSCSSGSQLATDYATSPVPCFDSPSSSGSEGVSDDLSTCDTVLDAVLDDSSEKEVGPKGLSKFENIAALESLATECDSLRQVAAFLGRQLHEARCRVEELQEVGGHSSCPIGRPRSRRASWPPDSQPSDTPREAQAHTPMPAPSVSILVSDFDEKPRTRRLELVADDNGADLTLELRRRLHAALQDVLQDVDVFGTVRPGAGTRLLVQDVRRCLPTLRPGDAVVLIAGANENPLSLPSWRETLLEMLHAHAETAFVLLLVEILLRPGPCSSPAWKQSVLQSFNDDIHAVCGAHGGATWVGHTARHSAVRVVTLQGCLNSAQFKPSSRSLLNKSGKIKLAKEIAHAVKKEWISTSD